MPPVDPFSALMDAAADPAFRARMGEIADTIDTSPGMELLDPAVYLACFSTPAGRAVLRDLYMRYVNVSRMVPGEAEGAGFYREGMAQVVFDIAAMCEAAAEGDDDADES